jgi:hypothetical protein
MRQKKNAQKMPMPGEVPMLCRISGSTVGEALFNFRFPRTALRDTDPSRARARARAWRRGSWERKRVRFKPVGLLNRYNMTKLFSLARRSLGSHAAHVQGLVIVFDGGFLGQALARHKNAERRTKMLQKNSIIVQSPLRRGFF